MMDSIWYWVIGLIVICGVWLIIEAIKAPFEDEFCEKCEKCKNRDTKK